MSRPALLTSQEVAILLGYKGQRSLWSRVSERKGDPRLAACRLPGPAHRSWSRARLEAAGYLVPEAAPVRVDAPLVTPAPSLVIATWRVA